MNGDPPVTHSLGNALIAAIFSRNIPDNCSRGYYAEAKCDDKKIESTDDT